MVTYQIPVCVYVGMDHLTPMYVTGSRSVNKARQGEFQSYDLGHRKVMESGLRRILSGGPACI